MADITIDGSIVTGTARGMRSVVFVSPLVGYWFYLDSDGVFGYSKTTDGGATWGAQVNVDGLAATTTMAFDVWFDQWTPGDDGTKIHCWWFDSTNDDVNWRTLDTNGDVLGTVEVVFAGASAVAARGVFVSGTKTRSGYLYCAYDIDAGAEKGLHVSTDNGDTWSASLSATFVEATIDQCLLFPASNSGDDRDCWALYDDASANALTLKLWDYSAGAEVESATIQTFIENTTDLTGQYGFSGAVRHSDGHLIVASVNDRATATSDHQVYDITDTSTITTKTAITTNISNHYYPSIFIDQRTNDIYVAYNGLRAGTETLGTTTKVYYVKSTDGGATWSGGDTAYMQGATAAVFQVWAPISGPRFFVGWRVGTTLIGNAVSSVVMAPFAERTERLELSDIGQGVVELISPGALKLADGPVIASLSGGVADLTVVVGAEAIRLADTPSSQLTVLERAVGDEALRIADTASSQLTVLERSVSETIRIAEVLGTSGGLSGVANEALKLSDIVTAVRLPYEVVLTETLRLDDIGQGFTELIGVIHITDGPVIAQLVGGLVRQVSDESLRLADTVTPSITPLLAPPVVEAVGLTDTVTALLSPLQAAPQEALVIADAPALSINPEQALATEALSIADTASAQLTVLEASAVEAVRLADTVTASRDLIVLLGSEALKLSDVVTALLPVEETSATETLRLVDTINAVIQLAAGVAEALVVADVVTTLLNPLNVVVTEAVLLGDGPPATGGDRLASLSPDALKLADVVTAVLTPLNVSQSEDLKIADVVTAAVQLAVTVQAESLRVADTVSALLPVLEVSQLEALKLGDGPISGAIDRSVVLEVENLKLADVVTAALVAAGVVNLTEPIRLADVVVAVLTPEQAVPATEALRLTDTANAAMQLATSAAEAVRLADVVGASLDPLRAAPAEGLKLSDIVTARLELGAVAGESLRIADVLTVRLTPLLAQPAAEALKIRDLVSTPTTPVLVVAEAVHVQDQLTAVLETATIYVYDGELSTNPPVLFSSGRYVRQRGDLSNVLWDGSFVGHAPRGPFPRATPIGPPLPPARTYTPETGLVGDTASQLSAEASFESATAEYIAAGQLAGATASLVASVEWEPVLFVLSAEGQTVMAGFGLRSKAGFWPVTRDDDEVFLLLAHEDDDEDLATILGQT